MTVTARPGSPLGGDPPSTTDVGAIRDGDVLTVMASGDLDASSGTALEVVLTGALADDVPRHVVIDLWNVDFCDSAGVRLLTRAHRLATERGAHCRLSRPQPHVAWLLRITSAGDIMDPQD